MRSYASAVSIHGASNEMLADIYGFAVRLEAWQKENPSLVKKQPT